MDEKKLRQLLKKANLRASEVVRKRDKAYKENGVSDETPETDLIRLIIENPSLLERPIVEVGNTAVLARPIQKALELVN